MNKKDLILIAVTALVLAFGFMMYRTVPVRVQNTSEVPLPPQTASVATPATNGFYIGSLYATMVTYTDDGFSPSTVTIPKGGAVIFRNYSSGKMRVASNPHPEHNGYPTTGGCVGSIFDSCSAVPPKVSWSFTFDIPGTWGYHDHLHPDRTGTVVVQ